MTTPQPAQVGETWADNDPRCAGRTVRVDAIVTRRVFGTSDEVPCAVCTVLTPPRDRPNARTGHRVTIRLSRIRPTSTGYRLVANVDGES